ncbi:MAG TPA: tyrosine-type recombinase/integrase [Kribbella sp.]
MEDATTAWVVAIAAFKFYLRSAERSAGAIRLRTYYIARFAADVTKADPYHCDPFAGPTTGVGVDQLAGWLSNPDWQAETRKSARASIIAFYRWAAKTGRLTVPNPAAELDPISVPRALPRPTPDVVLVDALLTANDHDRLILKLAGYAGLRRAEIAKVHPDDFDWDTDKLLVRGKGGKERWVPVHPDLRVDVLAELARRESGKTGTGWRYYVDSITVDDYLFPGRDGHVQPDAIGKVLSRLLAGRWTGHTLRHRFATVALRVSRDLRAVQELLGHSKPETTARYTEVSEESKRTAVLGVAPEEPPGHGARGSPRTAYVLAA